MTNLEDDTPSHVCGRCRTPYGRSTLPCPNDPNKTTNRPDGNAEQ